ncbi:hypothetical protein EX895_005717 [Sporisorium graminicola]|uniref:RING-type domain-containing protein n=1 Tax=Sporisorium graminicola TaxID=280036 RepID=A0A4U7KMG9_9BASI|nr:hypothetical protein EX895_005717 [Sporisorium graminicola]TKY85555.1 hypothetical protein EX895_005717 [Sporisorium graminicola]
MAESASSSSTDPRLHSAATSPAASASLSAQQSHRIRLPTAAQRRRARELATVLLTLTNCSGCHRPVQDPVTLPCGHSTCLQCIKDAVLTKTIPAEDEVQPLPCLSHLPPRLPLGPMTVPCPAHSCPRSAIGRGIGVWAGHRPRYGLIPTYTERLPLGAQDVGPGAPPVDGFVMGVADHPLRLTVIGPQTRSKAHLFAVPPQGVEPPNAAAGAHQTATTLLPSLATSNMLRTDVTLSKAVAILMRYASSPLPRSPRQRRSLPASSTPSASTNMRSYHPRIGSSVGVARDPSTSAGSSAGARARAGAPTRRSTQARSGGRGQAPAFLSARRRQRPRMPHAGMGIFGQNESELESGTVGGIRAAASDSDDSFTHDSDYDSSADTTAPARYLRNTDNHDDNEDGWAVHTATDGERSDQDNSDHLWPDRVGGAYSRPPTVSNAARRRGGKDRLKRRRGRRSDGSASSVNSSKKVDTVHGDGKVAKTEVEDAAEEGTARHLDSGWSTEESSAGPHLRRDNGTETLVDAVRRRRAEQARGLASAASDADGEVVPNANKDGVEAKHSLALSSRVGLNGEPLIQSVATLHSELVESRPWRSMPAVSSRNAQLLLLPGPSSQRSSTQSAHFGYRHILRR